MIPIPSEYSRYSVQELLQAAELGHVAFDQRLLHALLDDASRFSEILKFALNRGESPRVDISIDLMRIFTLHPVPEVVEFLMSELRKFPDDVPDEMVEIACRVGEPALDPLIEICGELGKENREAAFLLVSLGREDSRVEPILKEIEADDPDEAQFLREVYEGTTAAVDTGFETYEIWNDYPEVAWPELEDLPAEERWEFFQSSEPELRKAAAASFGEDESFTDSQRDRLLKSAQEDADPVVRGLCWEALAPCLETDSVLAAALKRIAEQDLDPEERASLAMLLCERSDQREVTQAILLCYENPETRAKALTAMAKSFDTGFSKYVPAHVDDEDLDICMNAVMAVGMLRMVSEVPRIEKYFDDEEVRSTALFAYSLATPGPTSSFEMKKLYKRLEKMAGEFNDEDEAAVKSALNLRMRMHGKGQIYS
jgi:hypothetical protein